MTDTELTTLSTIAWLILTSALFVALAHWSAGNGSWTILPGVVRGLREWTAEEVTPLRPAASSPQSIVRPQPSAAHDAGEPIAEVEDL